MAVQPYSATAPIKSLAGTAAKPSITFIGDGDSGLYSPGANQVGISTGGTQRLLIGSDGTNSYVRLASGTSGIQFNGDTAAANSLDDYEEGTWTPGIAAQTGSFTALTVDIVRATYTKVGNVVTIQCFIRTDSYDETGASGNLIITGLPYASKSGSTRSIGSALLMEYNTESSFTGTFAALIGGSATEVQFVRVDQGANNLQVGQLQTGTQANRNWMSFTLTYTTD